MSKEKTVAIIQARMSSTRLPGKILADISGRPMLWHVVDRLKHCGLLDEIAVATSKNSENNVVETFCKENKIPFYSGSENDVLDRYYQAARMFEADVVIRITADCPLIDPVVTDKVVSEYITHQKACDSASNIVKRTYPRGLDTEAVSFRALGKCWQDAKEPHQREHVTIYLYEHPELFRMNEVRNSEDLSGLRWTVDCDEDMSLIREIYKRLYDGKNIFFMQDVLALYKKYPELADINKDIKQKPVKK
jgi:spore coat polysaccharide biosynthesis protein SpsF (cytidylyltransferase family)